MKQTDIGIAVPYAAQVRKYRVVLDKANLSGVQARVSEAWQGSEIPVLIVDWVRANNDAGRLGFLTDRKRLNVLHTRQQDSLTIVGDTACVTGVVPPEDNAEAQSDDEAEEEGPTWGDTS